MAAAEVRARTWEPEAPRALHDAMAVHRDVIEACVRQAASQHSITTDPPARAHFRASSADGRIQPSFRYLEPDRASEARPFDVALEQCLEPHLASWNLPALPPMRSISADVLVLPVGAPVPHQGCFASPESTGLQTTLAQNAQVRVELQVTEKESPNLRSGRHVQYPAKAILEGVQGTEIVQSTVTREGRLQDFRVIQSVQYMDQPVIEALRTWCMEPIVCNGQRADMPYVFRVKVKPERRPR